MKIVIIGGHLTPALSVIEELPTVAKVIYIGRKYALEGDSAVSFEYQEVTKLKIPFKDIKTGRLQRSFTKYTIPSLFKIPLGFLQAALILKRFKPDVVVGFGGYVSLPVVLAAYIFKIPVVIHEQTLEAGAANLFAAKYSEKICISHPSSKKFFPGEKTILTGDPIRKTITTPGKIINFDLPKPIIYITGGSLGSHFINNLIMNCLPQLLEKYSVIHQTGGARKFSDFEKLSILKEGLNKGKKEKYIISKFFSDGQIGTILSISDLVIGRAGINTVTELAALNKPSLLIPLPNTQKDEQKKNALYLKRIGLGEILDEKGLGVKEFLGRIEKMIKNIEKYRVKEEETFYSKNAAKKIVKVIYETAKDYNN